MGRGSFTWKITDNERKANINLANENIIEQAIKKNNKSFVKIVYPHAQPAFFNDTGTRYDPAAASDAWARMLAWFDKYLV